MSAAPSWKVYTPEGDYVAACKHPSDAGAIAALYSTGAEIRYGHPRGAVCWIEGADGHAGDSLDLVAETCYRRLSMTNEERRENIAIARDKLADVEQAAAQAERNRQRGPRRRVTYTHEDGTIIGRYDLEDGSSLHLDIAGLGIDPMKVTMTSEIIEAAPPPPLGR